MEMVENSSSTIFAISSSRALDSASNLRGLESVMQNVPIAVTALGEVVLVTQPGHEFAPHPADGFDVGAGTGGFTGEPVAGE